MKFDLKEQTPTATIELETDLGPLKIETKPIGIDRMNFDYQTAPTASGRVRAALIDSIVGWNLDKPDGTPWPCDRETKEKIVPQIVGVLAKRKGDSGGARLSLGYVLFEFAADDGNFLKN